MSAQQADCESTGSADLVAAAWTVRERSYAPYSRFRVGAALRGRSGRIYTGTNVENASLGLSICAERAAVCQAVAAGETTFTAIAICADSPQIVPPCGACRQVLYEFAPNLTVFLCGGEGRRAHYLLADLLQHPFASFTPEPTQE
jgi:cytidine deaminase